MVLGSGTHLHTFTKQVFQKWMLCLQIPWSGQHVMQVFKSGQGRSDFRFWKFLQVPGVVLRASVSAFSWVNNMPRVPGGTGSETAEAGLGPVSAWLGREPALWSRGPGTGWAISSCYEWKPASSKQLPESAAKFHLGALRQPSNGCTLTRSGRLFISQYPRPAWPAFAVIYGGLSGYVCQAWEWLDIPAFLFSWFDC